MNLLLILILIIVILLLFKTNKAKYKITYYISDIDNVSYKVVDRKDKRRASNLLAKIKKNINTLARYLDENKEKYKEYDAYIAKLNSGIRNTMFSEGAGEDGYTSYTVNKGDEMVFCLRDSQKNIHDTNLIMYVVIHELAHVACPEQGHTKLFSKIFAFLTKVSIEIGLYKKIDFYNYPTKYCGMTISDSII
jgi:predicted metal-dependent hydrolase